MFRNNSYIKGLFKFLNLEEMEVVESVEMVWTCTENGRVYDAWPFVAI